MTSPSLPSFSGDHPTCPKCGHGRADTRYQGHAIRRSDKVVPVGYADEHLTRSCTRCTYEWDEAVLTASGDQRPAEIDLFHEAAAKIRALHAPVECRCVKCGSRPERDTVCGHCGDPSYGAFDYPCPTLQALDAVAAAS